jgi:hypothetical protein
MKSALHPATIQAGISLGNYLSRHFARQLFKPALRPAAMKKLSRPALSGRDFFVCKHLQLLL